MKFHPLHRIALAVLLLAGSSPHLSAAATEPFRLGDDGERILVLAPHPDDETLAAGGLIQEALALDVPLRVCFFTMGDNNEIAFLVTRKHPVLLPGAVRAMGELRQDEAIAATAQLGLSADDLVFLGYPDHGTLDIWNHHWRTVPPLRSMLTRVTAVPYARALTPGSAYAGEDILDDLIEVIRDFQPTCVVLPHPADHNVDHRALHLFARVALWTLESEGIAPKLLAYPVHFTQWPEPRRYHPLRPATPPHFLDEESRWMEYVLAPFQVSNKLAAIRLHHSQYLYASGYLDSFIRKSELFDDCRELSLRAGSGSIDIEENDFSQFRPDPELIQDLTPPAAPGSAIGDQNAAEAASLGVHDNDFTHRSLSGDGTALTLSFQFQKPLSRSSVLTVSLFGYRADTPFGEMPKIAIDLSPRKIVAVKDLDATLPEDSVELAESGEDEIILRVPFSLLGDPEKLLAGAALSKGSLPVDWVAWRAIDLSDAPRPAPPAKSPPASAARADATRPAVTAPLPESPATMSPPPEESKKHPPLRPRVHLPRKSIPEKSEANEPIFW